MTNNPPEDEAREQDEFYLLNSTFENGDLIDKRTKEIALQNVKEREYARALEEGYNLTRDFLQSKGYLAWEVFEREEVRKEFIEFAKAKGGA